MMLEILFALSCKSTGNELACQKALEAGSKQSEVYQSLEKAEGIAKTHVMQVTGERAWGVAFVGWKVYKDRAVTYTLKPKVLVDDVKFKAGYDKTGSVAFEWRF